MTEIRDWKPLGLSREVCLAAVIFFASLSAVYSLALRVEDTTSYLFDLALALMTLGIGPGVLFNRLEIWERSFPQVPRVFGGIFLAGITVLTGLVFGSMEGLMGLAILASSIGFFTIFFLLIQQAGKTTDKMVIVVKKRYSLQLIKEIKSEMKVWLTSRDYHFEEEGNVLTVRFQEAEIIELGIHTVISNIPEKSGYFFTVKTNQSKDSPNFREMKQALTDTLRKMNEERDFESYPQVKRVECRESGNRLPYNCSGNKFYCKGCGSWKEESEVFIEVGE